jgi:hypothetical protein
MQEISIPMKLRLTDKTLVPAIRRPVDQTWAVFANYLITAFGDITRQNGLSAEDAELVYCQHRLRELDDQILDSLIYNVPPAFVEEVVLKGNLDEDSAGKFFDQRLQWRASKDSPFLLLGYVGTGKTTFLDYYFYTHLPRSRTDIVAAIVDFKTAPDTDARFVMHMIEKVDGCLADLQPATSGMTRGILLRLYENEVENIRASISDIELQEIEIDRLFAHILRSKHESDVATYASYVGKKIQLLRKDGKSLWVVLDNIDQHFHCLHHTAFVNAVSQANAWQCPLIIAMRYVTLRTPAARQTYDSFRPRRLKLSFPDVSEMIGKRIEYFKLLADDISAHPLTSTGNTLCVSDLSNEMLTCANLLRKGDFLARFLLPLSNYNLRRLLEILLSAFQSYYFFFDRFNGDRYIPTGRTIWKRFLFAHLLKNNEYYDPYCRNDQEQFVINLFENENPAVVYNQTIRIRILQALMHFGRQITLGSYIEFLRTTYNFNHDEILRALRVFLARELVAVKNVREATLDDTIMHDGPQLGDLDRQDIEIALTYSGRLHYDLLFTLEYVEIMKFSTYVDSTLYVNIQDPKNEASLEKRTKSTRLFVKYLVEQENLELSQCIVDRALVKPIMSELSALIEERLKEVESFPEHRRS